MTGTRPSFQFLAAVSLPLPEFCRTELSPVVIRLDKVSAGVSSRLLTNNYLRALKRRKWRARQDWTAATPPRRRYAPPPVVGLRPPRIEPIGSNYCREAVKQKGPARGPFVFLARPTGFEPVTPAFGGQPRLVVLIGVCRRKWASELKPLPYVRFFLRD